MRMGLRMARPSIIDHIAYLLVIHMPLCTFASADNFLGRWALPRAGNYAYVDDVPEDSAALEAMK